MPIVPHMYRSPSRRHSTDAAPDTDADAAPDQLSNLDTCVDADDPELLDEPDDAELSDEDFYRDLRGEVDRFREGLGGSSIADAERKVPEMRPHSPRWRPRDRYGNRIY